MKHLKNLDNQYTVRQFHNLCRQVMTGCTDSYARGYAAAGLKLETTEAIRAQAQYIYSNTRHWRGPESIRVKTELRRLSK